MVTGLALVLWPRWGLLALLQRYRELSSRELAEHALKHLHHCQYSGLSASLESLAGALRVSRAAAADLIQRLETLGLVSSSGGDLRLTSEGRSDALRVIRVHRLWEKYFAEHTSLPESLWHDEADRKEHITSADAADRLAASLGHPRFDPHGAPIPTPTGELPGPKGEGLTTLEVDTPARIVHVEDEPAEVYAQLAAQGLTVGAVIRMIASTSSQVRLEVAGNEQVIAPIVASNVSVEPLPARETLREDHSRLSQVSSGQKAAVIGILPTCRGVQRRRLLDLGIVPGTVIEPELISASGDPVAYRIRGALIALRENQAKQIEVREFDERSVQNAAGST
jgi:DtxR family Mn-dependent transcriptional regulator